VNTRQNITVIGPGAIGGLMAAWLCQDAANAVTVAARTPFSGLTLRTPDGDLHAEPDVITNPEQAPLADWILLATKAYDSEAASAWFPDPARGDCHIAVLQNGVDHVQRISRWFPRENILPVIVDCPTERLAPGRINQRGPALLTVPAGPLAERFATLFAKTKVDCKAVDDFITAAWWKLCLNAAGVVNALTLQPARIANDETAAALMRNIVDEAATVGRAEGARLAPDIADEVIGIYRSHPPDSINSLHADRMAGRPLEIDLRNGIVVELGRRHGIATPHNEMAVALLKIA
jgi:2-dehydropantoate 2-reductase